MHPSFLRPFATIALLSALLTGTAGAATYWVSPTGSSGATGADTLTHATTLAWFNANAKGGDVCRFKSGTYTDPVKPNTNGSSGSRIRYYGFPQDPGAVVVADIYFGYQYGSYSTARWLTVPGAMTGCYQAAGMFPVADSVVRCVARAGGVAIHAQASVFDSLTLTGNVTDTGQSHFVDISGQRDHNNGTIGEWTNGALNNRFTNSVVNMTVTTTASQGDVHGMLISAAAYNTIANNTFNFTVNACYWYFFAIEQYEGYYNTIQNNTWNVTMNAAPGGSRGFWTHRDSSSYNRYIGNTVRIGGSGNLSFMASNPGSFPGTVGHNLFSNNFIRDDSPQPGTGGFFNWYDGCRYDTLQFNTMITNSGMAVLNMTSGQSVTGLVIRHNTFYATGATVVDMGGSSGDARLTSNIYYSGTSSGSGSEIVKVPSGFGLDSSGVYFSPGGASHAIAYGGSDGTPGSGGNYGNANESRWGSPLFADSSYTNFNASLTANSWAAGTNFRDGYAGAIPFGGSSSDVTPPATVSNLALSQPGASSLYANWTAPGNDGMTGTAASYDMRWSTSPINAGNFAFATQVTTEPSPLPGGSPQSYVLLALPSGTTVYVALKTVDAAGNWSAISNLPSAQTLAGSDTTPPAAITDLNAH